MSCCCGTTEKQEQKPQQKEEENNPLPVGWASPATNKRRQLLSLSHTCEDGRKKHAFGEQPAVSEYRCAKSAGR